MGRGLAAAGPTVGVGLVRLRLGAGDSAGFALSAAASDSGGSELAGLSGAAEVGI